MTSKRNRQSMQGGRLIRFGLQAICLLHLACVFLPAARAQEPVTLSLSPDVPFEQHLVRQWTSDDGFPSEFVRDIIQTQDGYIWIATTDGVVRFDGHHFGVFNRARVAELPTDDIRTLYESRDGSLWIGSSAGLTRYKPGRPGTFNTIAALMGSHVEEIFEDRSGVIWVGTRTATWSADKDGEFKMQDDAPKHVMAICEDRQGTLWFGAAMDGLYRARGRGFVRVTGDGDPGSVARKALSDSGVYALLAHVDGSLWIGTKLGLLKHNDGQFGFHSEGLNGLAVSNILQTHSGSMYVTVRRSVLMGGGGKLMRWTGRSFEEVISKQAAWICEDREGSLWVGGTRGVVRQYRNNWTSLALPDDGVHCIVEDEQGTMWLGTTSGLRRIRDGEVTRIVDGLPDLFVQSIAHQKDSLWIGTPKGLARWSDGKVTAVPGTEDLNITTVYEDSRGVVWIGLFESGAYRFEEKSLTAVPEVDGHVHWFHEDAEGVVWIGNEKGLCRQVGNRMERVKDRNLDKLANVTPAHYVDGEDLWLASITGIARYRAGRFDVFTTREGLLAERVMNLHGDAHGNLWMGTPKGFFYTSLQELDDVAAGRAAQVDSHWMEQDYGPSVLRPYRGFPKACRASDGTTWFATAGPVLKVHADPIPRNLLPPPVVIQQAKIDGEVTDANGPFELMSGRHQVELEFSVPTFFRPQRAEVKYRLRGYDDDWVDANGQRVATYMNLRPGNYQFQVIAHNGDGVWNKTGDTLGFTALPRWFETLWFRGLCLMIGLGIVMSVLKWRITAVRRQHEEHQQHQEELNRALRIATMGQLTASIAHEVNQPLCAILNDANSGQRLLSGEEIDVTEAKETFQDIAAAAKRASDVITHIRELLSKHSTERAVVDVNQLIQESLHLVRPELARRQIQLDVDVEPSLPNVIGDHVQLQQVLINLILNASDSIDSTEDGPRDVRVRTETRENQLEISVRDTGAGFDPDDNVHKLFEPFYTTKPEGIGMGLAITQSIIQAHNGSVRAERNDERGATFIVTLPILSGDADE